jgi:nudix-type nucleoside diphosphatase (YffH/AdpP family)
MLHRNIGSGHMTKKPTVEAVETLFKGWGRYLKVTLRQDGETYGRELEDHGSGVAVLPYDPVRRVALLVRQTRVGPLFLGDPAPELLEIPAGLLDHPGEAPEAAARREVLEEIGVRLTSLEAQGEAYSSPGCTTESIHLFLAAYEGADRIAAGGGLAEEYEGIEVVEVALAELLADALSSRLRDMKTLALVLMLHAKRPDLF